MVEKRELTGDKLKEKTAFRHGYLLLVQAPGERNISVAQSFDILQNEMVDRQLVTRGIKSPTVLDAMRNVPRHLFVAENMHSCAYDDSPLPIGLGQTISQPYIVAYMTEQLEPYPGMKVLEIGTGSGYQAAVLAYLGCEVYTIELLEEHARMARQALTTCNYDNVSVRHGNGYLGWQEEAPFDAIIVTAAPDVIPPALIAQLSDNGRMVVPVGEVHAVQSLKLLTNHCEATTVKELILVRFDPMINL